VERFREYDKKLASIKEDFESFKVISISGMNNTNNNSNSGQNVEMQKHLIALQQTEQTGR